MLKVKFIQIDNAVVAKILEQDEKIRNKSFDFSYYIAHNHKYYSLRSADVPEINKSILFLRGTNRELDHDYFINNFESIEEATKYIKNMSQCIHQYNLENQNNKPNEPTFYEEIIAE